MAYSLRFSAVTDVGRSRKKNDDSGYAGPHLLLVADGMGGAPAGDLASSLAVATMRRLDSPPPDDMLEALAGAVHRANDRLAEAIDEDPAVDGMGTTVSAALFDGNRIAVAHLGDSRGYLWHQGELLRMTADHTWVQSLIDEGRISEQEAKTHSYRSMLLRVLDGRHDNDPDLTLYDVEPGDRILLCSDGLSGFVSHERLERALSVGTAESVATELVQLALDAASNDNITVVVADVVDEPPLADAAPQVVGAAAAAAGRQPVGGGAAADGDGSAGDDVDPEELRYAPRPPQRLRGLRRATVLLILLVLLGLTGAYAYGWTQDQYYVAADGERVAIYRGVQADLPGLRLHSVYETQDLSLTELPSGRRTQVEDGMMAGSLEEARAIVNRLEGFARSCATVSASTSDVATSGASTSSQTTSATSEPGSPPTSETASRPTATRSTGDADGGSGTASPRRTAGAPPTTGPAQSAVVPAATSPTATSTSPPTTPAPSGTATASTAPGSPEECAGASPDGSATATPGTPTSTAPSAPTGTTPETTR